MKFEPFTPRFPERIREHWRLLAQFAKEMIVHIHRALDRCLHFLRQALDTDSAIKQTLYPRPTTRDVKALKRQQRQANHHRAGELRRASTKRQHRWLRDRARGAQVVYGFMSEDPCKALAVCARGGGLVAVQAHRHTTRSRRALTTSAISPPNPSAPATSRKISTHHWLCAAQLRQSPLAPQAPRITRDTIGIACRRRQRRRSAEENASSTRIIDALYRASRRGVETTRGAGICCLRRRCRPFGEYPRKIHRAASWSIRGSFFGTARSSSPRGRASISAGRPHAAQPTTRGASSHLQAAAHMQGRQSWWPTSGQLRDGRCGGRHVAADPEAGEETLMRTFNFMPTRAVSRGAR